MLFTEFTRKVADKGSQIGAIFIYLSKVLDLASHSIVLNKLPLYGISGNELMWFTDYSFSRSLVVQCNGFSSEVVPISCGVLQGLIIRYLLVILQINTAHNVLKHSKFKACADDTVMYMSSSSLNDIGKKLSEDLKSLKSWFDTSELEMNLKKGNTEAMIFGTSKG